ncbi:hypothetical protein KKF61_05580 [Patescibacteria group bacterium]|nr:hypothetical protein [Patescibacteria group bacterium]MBU0964343.1 hypothetical protein [Patescibacteria group bacterium]
MAINLLPEEEKTKIKTDTSRPVTPIEMTGAELPKKKKPAVKQSGVLQFFQGAFLRPKVNVSKEEEKDKKFPEKVQLKQKITFHEPAERIEPRIEVHRPKTEPVRAEPSLTFIEKVARWFRNLFAPKKKSTLKEPYRPPVTEDQFPKYKSVKAEKLFARYKTKGKPAKVISVVTEYSKPKADKPLFAHLPRAIEKEAPVPEPPEKKEEPPVAPEKEEKSEAMDLQKIELEKEIRAAALKKEEPRKKKEKKGPSRFTLWLRKFFASMKNIFSRTEKPKKHKKEQIQKPPEEVKPKEEKELDKISLVPPPPEPEKKEVPVIKPFKKKKEKKPSKLGLWLSKFLQSFKNLFKREKKEAKPILLVEPLSPPGKEEELNKINLVPPPPKLQKKEEPFTKPLKEKKPSKLGLWLSKFLQSIKNLFSREKKAEKKEAKPILPVVPFPPLEKEKEVGRIELVPPPPPIEHKPEEILSAPREEEPVEKNEIKEEIPSPSFIPPPPEKKSQEIDILAPPPVPSEAKSGIELTEPEKELPEPSGLEWEVNLIPEDALEIKFSVTKFLYMVLFMVFACGIVFGAWLAANFYYNNITIEIREVNEEIAEADTFISQYQELLDKVRNIKMDIATVQTMMDEHVYWSEIFSMVEKYTIPDVYYTSMTSDVGGSINISAIGKDYESAIKQLIVYENAYDFAESVIVSDITFIAESEMKETPEEPEITPDKKERPVSFIIHLDVLPSIFYYEK